MKPSSRRFFGPLCTVLVAGCLLVSPAASVKARAQAPDPAAAGEGDENKGRPLDGYLLMVMLAAGAFFVVGKTARR